MERESAPMGHNLSAVLPDGFFRQVLDTLDAPVIVLNHRLEPVFCNRCHIEASGISAEELLGKPLPDIRGSNILQAEDLDRLLGHARQVFDEGRPGQVEFWVRSRNGGPVHLRWSAAPLRDEAGEIPFLVAFGTDITAHKKKEEKLSRLAQRDGLTGLLNRNAILSRLRDLAAESGEQFSVLFIDLDGFKAVNDLHGHKTGDVLLQQMAQRLSACIRTTDPVGRIGGDEFTVLLPGMRERRDLAQLAGKIITALSVPYEIDGTAHTVGASIGICEHACNCDPEEFLRRADHAMYQAKRNGKNRYHFYG